MIYYGQFDPPVDRFLYERYFRHYDCPGTMIECGAFDGLSESSGYFFEKMLRWKSINIEAFSPAYNDLVKNRPGAININAAISNTNGHAKFTAVLHPHLGEKFGNSSLSHSDQHLDDLRQQGCLFEEHTVQTRSYSSIIQELSLTELDLFILDIEGHEEPVLDSLSTNDLLPKVFVIEHGHIGLEALKSKMTQLGYIYDCSLFANSFFVMAPLDSRILKSIAEHDIGENRLLEVKTMINNVYSQGKEIESIMKSVERRLDSINNSLVNLQQTNVTFRVCNLLRKLSKKITTLLGS